MKLVLQTKIGRHVTRLSEQDSNHGWLRSVFQPFVVEDLDEPSVAVGHFSSTDGPAWYFDANELPPFIWLFCRCCWCFASTEEKLIHELIFQKFNFQKTPKISFSFFVACNPLSLLFQALSLYLYLWPTSRPAFYSNLSCTSPPGVLLDPGHAQGDAPSDAPGDAYLSLHFGLRPRVQSRSFSTTLTVTHHATHTPVPCQQTMRNDNFRTRMGSFTHDDNPKIKTAVVTHSNRFTSSLESTKL